jgi:hypothetical protein
MSFAFFSLYNNFGVVSKPRYDRIPSRVDFAKCMMLQLRVRLREFQNDFRQLANNLFLV